MKINITVPIDNDSSIQVTLNLPVNADLDEIHDNIEKYVSCEECICCSEGVYRDVSVRLDGCLTTENYLSVFDVACERNKDTKAYIRIS